MIQSILPEESLLPQTPPETPECISCPYGWVQGVRQPDGRLRVDRMISTDPAAYLDERFAPGGIIDSL